MFACEMHECANHPGVEARRFCQKTGRWLCDECGSRCTSPDTYCKFRTACIIWALQHDREGDLAPPPARERA
jgi:hypothetical protein